MIRRSLRSNKVAVRLNRQQALRENISVTHRADFDGIAQAAAVSRDGHFIAFLSDPHGQMDVWLTQAMPELINLCNLSVRTR